MTKKPILTSKELIDHMKAKGIKFNIVDETDAQHFLDEHNYFFKLSAYRKNYVKYQSGTNKGKYIDLDFAYLKDLSTIDMHLRHLLLELSLDIEHAIKLTLIKDIESNPDEDGYNIVSQYIANHNYIFDIKKSNYCKAIVKKHTTGNPPPNCPIWSFCEIISFGELTRLYDLYYKLYPNRLPIDPTFIYAIKNIRNAVAHNNCLINNFLTHEKIVPSKKVSNMVSKISYIKTDLRKNSLQHYFLHDFAALLHCYSILVKSEKLKEHQYKKIKKLFYIRMIEHRCYYKKNNTLSSTFKFCHLLIKSLLR